MPESKPASRILWIDPAACHAPQVAAALEAWEEAGYQITRLTALPAAPWQSHNLYAGLLWSPGPGQGTPDLWSVRRGAPGMPVVALPDSPNEAAALELLAAGADEILPLPEVTPETLKAALLRARTRTAVRLRCLETSAPGADEVAVALRVRERHAQALLDLSRQLERAESHAEILAAAREAITAVIGMRRVWLYALSTDGEYLQLILEDEGGDPLLQKGDVRVLRIAGDPMLEEIVTGTEVVVVEDARTDPRTNKEIVHALGNRTIVNVPILLASRRLGALGTGTFGEEGVRPLTGEEREFLAALGSHVAAVLNRLTVGLERDQAEHALKVFRMLLDQSSDALEVIDPETARFLDCNEQSHLTLGWTRDELLRMAVWDIDPLITPENWGERMDALRRARRATIQGIHRRKDGSTFPVEINAGWVDLDRPYVVSVARDVSERQQLEEQVRQSQKMEAIGKLAGGVAHDFNNLLCVISGYAELCLMRLPESDPSQKMLSEIRSAGEQAARLTRQLLAFSRQQVLAPTVLDLNEVVRDVRTMLRRLIGEDVLLTTMLAPDLCRVQVDAGQINQVIMNLAINARDAMPDGGQLILETFNVDRPLADRETTGETRMQKAVLLSVTDTGWGMTPEVRERIFEPFYTTKGMGRGTGLGLAVVHGIVKQSGGEIEVETAEGEGTTFRIYLPAIT